jgi:phospholipid transport system transporter-binding protein
MNKRKQGAGPRSTRRGRPARAAPAAGTGQKAGSVAFAVAAECTVADSSSLKSGLAKLVDESDVVTLDISAVQRIDTAGLQVIAAFVRERESHGRQVKWQGSATALSTAARLLGLSTLLKLPAAAGQVVETVT